MAFLILVPPILFGIFVLLLVYALKRAFSRIEYTCEVTLENRHKVSFIRKSGLLKDTLEGRIDGQVIMSCKIGSLFENKGTDSFMLEEVNIKVHWKWSVFWGDPIYIILCSDQRLLAHYGNMKAIEKLGLTKTNNWSKIQRKKSLFLVEKPSFGFLILGGFVCFYFAGFITSMSSIEPIGEVSDMNSYAPMTFSMKAGAIWGLAGVLVVLVMPTRASLAYSRLFAMQQKLRDSSVFFTMVLFSIVVGLISGMALSMWVLPILNLPTNMVLKSGIQRILISCISTVVATIIPVPVAVRFVQTSTYFRAKITN